MKPTSLAMQSWNAWEMTLPNSRAVVSPVDGAAVPFFFS